MSNTVVFIHGMFQTPRSWESWQRYFRAQGYTTTAPAWPFHDGDPAELREHIPEGLGELHLASVIEQYAALVGDLGESPIVIGHSVGGLIAQVLASRGLVRASVCIDSVAPNRMLAVDLGFFKNSAAVANPIARDAPFVMTPEGFHSSFANTLSAEESDAAYQRFAIHDSRNVLRDCMGEAGTIDVDQPHPPLLFVAGEKDEIIPPELNEKNAKAYTDNTSIVGYSEFPSRGHFICGEPGWEEVAGYVSRWLQHTLAREVYPCTPRYCP